MDPIQTQTPIPPSHPFLSKHSAAIGGVIVLLAIAIGLTGLMKGKQGKTDVLSGTSPITITTEQSLYPVTRGQSITVKLNTSGVSALHPLTVVKLILRGMPDYVTVASTALQLSTATSGATAIVRQQGQDYVLLMYGIEIKDEGTFATLTLPIKDIELPTTTSNIQIVSASDPSSALASQVATLNDLGEYVSYPLPEGTLFALRSGRGTIPTPTPPYTPMPTGTPSPTPTACVPAPACLCNTTGPVCKIAWQDNYCACPSPVPTPPYTPEPTATPRLCNSDIKICSDGMNFVGRNPSNNCAFDTCYDDQLNVCLGQNKQFACTTYNPNNPELSSFCSDTDQSSWQGGNIPVDLPGQPQSSTYCQPVWPISCGRCLTEGFEFQCSGFEGPQYCSHTNRTFPGSSYSACQSCAGETPQPKPQACGTDVKLCADGRTTVTHNPYNQCAFNTCPVCGNDICEADESNTCNQDCSCNNNGICEPQRHEDSYSCASDCTCKNGALNSPKCDDFCGNGLCEAGKGETADTCNQDCSCNNNGICEGNMHENTQNCAHDCPTTGQTPTPTACTTDIKGDLNADGKVNIADLSKLADYLRLAIDKL